jgi:hypothetical protein
MASSRAGGGAVAGDDRGRRRHTRVFVVFRIAIAAIFVVALVVLLALRRWVGAAVVFPFAAAQTYFAVAAVRGRDLGYR